MNCYIMGIGELILFAVVVTGIMLGLAWCVAFVFIYYTGESVRKGLGESESKFFIKITKDLFKW